MRLGRNTLLMLLMLVRACVAQRWMVNVLRRFGFWGVLAFSAYPNAAFDLVGICCGHFMMPFLTFFGGTFVGKALIKAPAQAAGAVLIFGSSVRACRPIAAVFIQ
eukprot:3678631-Pyramimonas_sp.AAC.1